MNHQRLITVATTALATSLLAISAQAGPSHSSLPELLPPSSNPGECWARVTIPATYDRSRQGVVAEEGYTQLEVRQPVLQSRQEQVLTKEPSTRFVVRQPSYRTVSEQIMVRPAYDKLSVSQPQFSMVQDRIQTSAPNLVWKKGNPGELRRQGYKIHSTADSRAQAFNHGTSYQSSQSSDQSAFYGAGLGGQACGPGCEIWCLVEEPGESVSVRRRVMTSPGRVQRMPVPAKYQTVQKQVVSDPGGVEQIHVPAEYQNITIEDVVDLGGVYDRPVAPTYASVETKTLISPERHEWRRVVCKPGTGSIGGPMNSQSYSSGVSQSSAYSHSEPNLAGGSSSSSHNAQPSHYTGSAANQILYPAGTQHSYSAGHQDGRQHMTIKDDTRRKWHRSRDRN